MANELTGETKKERLRRFQTDFNNLGFNMNHHGDEVIVGCHENKIHMKVKIQLGLDEMRTVLLTFESQTQVERLFPAIMKGLK